MNEVVIHIGLPKTGTSALQSLFFPNIKGFKYYDGNTKVVMLPDDVNIIYSYETLSGRYERVQDVAYGETILKRVKKLYPDAKIIVGRREVDSLIRSLYNQYVKRGGVVSYAVWYRDILERDVLMFKMEEFIAMIQGLFCDVFVYDFEDLKTNFHRVVCQICDFIGCDIPEYENKLINVRLSKIQLKLICFLNRYWKSEKNSDGFLPYGKYFNPTNIIKLGRRS